MLQSKVRTHETGVVVYIFTRYISGKLYYPNWFYNFSGATFIA